MAGLWSAAFVPATWRAGLWPAAFVPARIVGDSNAARKELRPFEHRKFNLNSAVKEDENGADTRKHKGF